MNVVLYKHNPKVLTGYKGRDDISDLVYGAMHARNKIKFYNNRSMLDYENPKEIENLKYWSDRAVENVRKLRNFQKIYIKAYPRKGDLLFKQIVNYAKATWLKLEELNERKEYYWRKSMNAFNNGLDVDYWNKKIDELDEEIHQLENIK